MVSSPARRLARIESRRNLLLVYFGGDSLLNDSGNSNVFRRCIRFHFEFVLFGIEGMHGFWFYDKHSWVKILAGVPSPQNEIAAEAEVQCGWNGASYGAV